MNLKILFLFLIIKVILISLLLSYYPMPLAPDEAQYWTWSQALDWGYYSKPPGIAWQIWLGTLLFGNSEFGVRIISLFLSCLITITIYYCAFYAGQNKRLACLAALAFTFSPIGFYLSVAATTDIGSLLFFTLAITRIVKQIKTLPAVNFLEIGFYIGVGALFKWTCYLLWVFILLYALFSPKFRSKTLLFGIAISCLGLLPSLIWNLSHDWATFQHVGKTIYQANVSKHGNFFDFLAAQIGIMSPFFFFFFLLGIASLIKKIKKEALSFGFIGMISLGVLCYLSIAFFKKMQPNWALFFYPAAFIMMAYYADTISKKWINIGFAIAISINLISLSIPLVQASNMISLPYKVNPFQQNLGWQRFEGILQSHGFNASKEFLLADKYQTASLLSFYNPEKARAYFLNVSESRRNQFSYWPGLEDQKGKNAYFIITENKQPEAHLIQWYQKHYQEKLLPYFSAIEPIGTYSLFENNEESVKFAIVFYCKNYSGKKPQESNQF